MDSKSEERFCKIIARTVRGVKEEEGKFSEKVVTDAVMVSLKGTGVMNCKSKPKGRKLWEK